MLLVMGNGRHFTGQLKGHVDVVKVLIQNRADVNAATKDKQTALHTATRIGHVDVAKFDSNGADVNAVKKDNWTALHYAAMNGHVDVAKVLIRNGADVNAVMKFESTALHVAAFHGYVDVKVLLQNGAEVDAKFKCDMRALHVAAFHGYVDVAKVLIRNGADVNAVDKYKETPLCSSSGRLVRFMLQLLCFGAEINESAINHDKTELLRPIARQTYLTSRRQRYGNDFDVRRGETFMWNLIMVLSRNTDRLDWRSTTWFVRSSLLTVFSWDMVQPW